MDPQKGKSACRPCSYCPFSLFYVVETVAVLTNYAATALSAYLLRRNGNSACTPHSYCPFSLFYVVGTVAVLTNYAATALSAYFIMQKL